MTQLSVLGIGSPFGDDHIAFEVINLLQKNPRLASYSKNQLAIQYHDRPGVGLLSLMSDANTVILIDAVLASEKIGQIITLTGTEIDSLQTGFSSHQLGVAETIALGRALNQLPAQIFFFGIAIDPNKVSSAVNIALPHLTTKITSCIQSILTNSV